MHPITSQPAAELVQQLKCLEDARAVLRQIDELLQGTDEPLLQARLYKLAQVIGEAFPGSLGGLMRASGNSLEQAAFAAVARSVERQIEINSEPRAAAILHDQVCWVTAPARLDFSGGWSDTPPICSEVGGTVVNAAVTLNGQYPIQVVAKLSDRRSIMLRSIDLGEQLELRDTASILRHAEPGDWASLPKAAIVLSGLVPRDPAQPLTEYLDVLGGGLDINLFSALPKGSGLGTSSILGSALLACLARIVGDEMEGERAGEMEGEMEGERRGEGEKGRKGEEERSISSSSHVCLPTSELRTPNPERPTPNYSTLIARTSLLEQMLTTGGGWQDQVGGITRGVKIIRTLPGPDQVPSISWTQLDQSPGAPFHGRVLLCYTGQKRLAKNILQNVVGHYLARDRETLRVVEELKAAAEEMKQDLDRGSVDGFAAGLDRYWSLKKRIDPGSSNPQIEETIQRVDRYLLGKVMCGAGGGGFLFMVGRDADATQKAREALTASPSNPAARFFDFEIDQVGLKVTVL